MHSQLRLAIALSMLILCGLLAACGRDAAPSGPVRAVVTIAPLQGLLEPLLPVGSDLKVLIQPGRSEHGYEFTPADIASVANADIVVHVGLGLEGRFQQVLAKPARGKRQAVCFADAVGIIAGSAAGDGHDHHDHADHADHAHAIDQHLWLDPVLVKQLVPALKQAVAEALKARGVFDEPARLRLDNAAAELEARIQQTHEKWESSLAPLKGRTIVTHHNAFPRAAERYGLRVAAVIRGAENSEPTPARIAEIVDAIKSEKARAIFIEPQFSTGAAMRIAAAAGVRVARLDPLGNGDWFKLMDANLESLTTNLGD